MPPTPETQPTVVPSALPSVRARALAVLAVVVAGVCGALIGYTFADLQCTGDCTTWKGVGLIVGALMSSVGVAVVAVLTLRAMDEWQTTASRQRQALDRTRPTTHATTDSPDSSNSPDEA